MAQTIIERRFQRQLKRLSSSPHAPHSWAEHLDVMVRLMSSIENDVRHGIEPEERQLVSLAAHSIALAIELGPEDG